MKNIMINFLTVHYENPFWIDIQKKYIEKNTSEEYRIYSFMNGVEEKHKKKHFYVCDEPLTSDKSSEHAIKLNILADIASGRSSRDDLIVFIDGDAFPIDDIDKYMKEKLREKEIMAVQRTENAGDIQPHPCFCATSVGFWDKIDGDWKPGYTWTNEEGKEVSDVGGELLKKLTRKNISWYKMNRTNKKNIHPLWFGIYDNVIYHHGAGFRRPISRIDQKINKQKLKKYEKIILKMSHKVPKIVPGLGSFPGIKYLQEYLNKKYSMSWDSIDKKNSRKKELVVDMIKKEEMFYKKFM